MNSLRVKNNKFGLIRMGSTGEIASRYIRDLSDYLGDIYFDYYSALRN